MINNKILINLVQFPVCFENSLLQLDFSKFISRNVILFLVIQILIILNWIFVRFVNHALNN